MCPASGAPKHDLSTRPTTGADPAGDWGRPCRRLGQTLPATGADPAGDWGRPGRRLGKTQPVTEAGPRSAEIGVVGSTGGGIWDVESWSKTVRLLETKRPSDVTSQSPGHGAGRAPRCDMGRETWQDRLSAVCVPHLADCAWLSAETPGAAPSGTSSRPGRRLSDVPWVIKSSFRHTCRSLCE